MKGRLYKWRIAAVFLLALLSTAGAQEGDLAEAQRLNEQVLLYYAAGQYQQAIPLAQRALAIFEKALGPAQAQRNLSPHDRARDTSPTDPPSSCTTPREAVSTWSTRR
jgi:tetratricopeptide (TPR) repeat protein